MKLKSLLILMAATVLGAGTVFGSNPFTSTEVGKVFKYVNTDSKGRITSYTLKTIKGVYPDVRGTLVEVAVGELDKNGKPSKHAEEIITQMIITQNTAISPKDNFNIMVDEMKKAMGPEADNVSFDFKGVDMIYPLQPVVGEQFPDFKLEVYIEVFGMAAASMGVNGPIKAMEMKSNRREFVGMEEITVEAGTFNCYKIVEVMEIKNPGAIQTITETAWYADGIGVVMSTSSVRANRIDSTTKLVSITEE